MFKILFKQVCATKGQYVRKSSRKLDTLMHFRGWEYMELSSMPTSPHTHEVVLGHVGYLSFLWMTV
jgi:hypothetical protein